MKKNINKYIEIYCRELENLMTTEFLAQRLNIEISDLKKYIKINKDNNKKLLKEEINDLISQMLKNNELKKLIIEKNKEKKDLFIKYLKQEIDLSENNFAFVELNGTGRTQDYTADFISEISDIKNIKTFFLVSLPYKMKQKENSIKTFYYYPGEFLADYLELLCRTEHGQTIGYREENRKIVPVFETENYEIMTKWGFKDYIEGIAQYSEMMSEYMVKNNIKSSDSKFFSIYFDYFRYNLDKETKNKISQIPFLIFGNEQNTKSSLPTHHLLSILTDKVTFKHFLARKYHSFASKVLLLLIILFNSKNVKTEYLNFLYYRFFMR